MNVISEDSSSYFFLDAQNDTIGPHSLAELETLAAQCVIVADTMIAREGWSEWRPWGEIVAEGQTSSLTP